MIYFSGLLVGGDWWGGWGPPGSPMACFRRGLLRAHSGRAAAVHAGMALLHATVILTRIGRRGS